jgi:hypothetical protein
MVDMTWTAPDIERVEPLRAGASELGSLHSWIRYHRQTLLWKCRGLTAAQLATASVAPSDLTLLGLIRHLTDVERGWFRRGVGGDKTARPLYYSDENPDGDIEVGDADAEAGIAAYRAEWVLVDQAIAGAELDARLAGSEDVDVRWVFLHMIEEYARHNGHADLIRERIDGSVGD